MGIRTIPKSEVLKQRHHSPYLIEETILLSQVLKIGEKKLEKKRKNMKKTLKQQYTDICNAYRDALNEMWETLGDWMDEDLWWFDVADCVIGIAEVRELVDRKVDFNTFLAWYDYDLQIHYAESLGKKVDRINLHTWLNGFPEEHKVSKEQRDAWEKEYWEKEFKEGKSDGIQR